MLLVLTFHLIVAYLLTGLIVSCIVGAKRNVKEPDIIHVIYTFIIVLILWPLFVSELFSKE